MIEVVNKVEDYYFKSYPIQYNPIIEYFNQIKNKKVIVSLKIYKVYKKIVENIHDTESQWIYSPEHALHPIEFIESFCKHIKGKYAGTPIELELWQKAGIATIFGFINKKTKERKYQEIFWVVARKNGKSTISSGIALYLLGADGEGGPEVYTVATKKDQAKIVWNDAKKMVNKSPLLKLDFVTKVAEILTPFNDGQLIPLGRDSDTTDGLNVHGAIMDEVHAWKTMQMYDVVFDGISARDNPLILAITTAGTIRNSVYDIKYEESENIINGLWEDEGYKNERFLPLIYELDSREEWIDESCWLKANPGLGSIKKIDAIKTKVNRAKKNALLRVNLLTKDFNIRSNANEAWLSFEDLNNTNKFELSELNPSYAIGGSDLSSSIDLTAACIAFMLPNDKNVYFKHMYWIPEDLVEDKVNEDKVPYDKWIELGYVRTTPGNKVHYKFVEEWFDELRDEFDIYIPWHGYDAWSAEYYVESMKDKHGSESMIKVYQGKKTLSGPMENLGADLKKKHINYNNNPVTKWCLSNTIVDIDKNGNIQPDKSNKRRRIDGLACMLNAYVILNEKMDDYINLIGA